jgi:hypothetical protein
MDPQTKLQVFSGDVEVTSNLVVDTNTLHVDTVSNKVGIGSTQPVSDLEVSGTLAISSNFDVGTSGSLSVDAVNSRVGIGEATPSRALEIHPDTDVTAIIGKTRIGYMNNVTDHAAFGHIDNTGTNEWALIQNSSGTTILNNISGTTEIRENGTIKHVINGTSTSDAKIGINTNSANSSYPIYINGVVRQDLPVSGTYVQSAIRSHGSNTEFYPYDWNGNDSVRSNRFTTADNDTSFVVPVKGIYEISYNMTTYDTGGNSRGYDIQIYVNGSRLNTGTYSQGTFSTSGYFYRATNTYQHHGQSVMADLNANDRIATYVEPDESEGIHYNTQIYICLVHPT